MVPLCNFWPKIWNWGRHVVQCTRNPRMSHNVEMSLLALGGSGGGGFSAPQVWKRTYGWKWKENILPWAARNPHRKDDFTQNGKSPWCGSSPRWTHDLAHVREASYDSAVIAHMHPTHDTIYTHWPSSAHWFLSLTLQRYTAITQQNASWQSFCLSIHSSDSPAFLLTLLMLMSCDLTHTRCRMMQNKNAF